MAVFVGPKEEYRKFKAKKVFIILLFLFLIFILSGIAVTIGPMKFSFPDGRTVEFEARGDGTGKLTMLSETNFFAVGHAMWKEPRVMIEVDGVNFGDFPLDGSTEAFASLFSCVGEVAGLGKAAGASTR